MAWNRYLVLLITFVLFRSSWSYSLTSSKGNLEVVAHSERYVEGSYIDFSSGRGIRFVSTPDTLLVTTLSAGEPLLLATEPVGSLRLVSIGSSTFIQSGEENSVDYAVPGIVGWQNVSEISKDHEGLVQLRKKAAETVESSHASTLQNSIQILLSRPEIELFEHAARALGEEAGINGQDSPSVLPFYLAALHLQKLQLYSRSNSTTGVNWGTGGHYESGSTVHYQLPKKSKRSPGSCSFNTCPPCPEEKCLGLCGPSCHCWKWACGDCCWHLGCYDHDKCCEKKFIRTKCLLPFKFRCEEHYQC